MGAVHSFRSLSLSDSHIVSETNMVGWYDGWLEQIILMWNSQSVGRQSVKQSHCEFAVKEQQ